MRIRDTLNTPLLRRKKLRGLILTCAAVVATCSFLSILSPDSVPASVRRLSVFEPKLVLVMRPLPPVPTWTLPGGVDFPLVSSNTASLSAEQTEAMVIKSLSLEITAVDFHLGGTEREGVTAVLRRIPRKDLFLVTKIDKPPEDMTDPEAAAKFVETTVNKEWKALDVETVDVLLLKDSPSCEVMQAQWSVLERLLSEGKTRAIGTYNYCRPSLECILETAETPPSLNYVMRHVGMGPDATDLIQYQESLGIRTVSYGTLGEPVALPELLTDPVLREIAEDHGRSVEEVALRWNVQAGYGVSSRPSADYNPEGMACPGGEEGDCDVALMGMRAVFGWELNRRDVARLDGIKYEEYLQSPTYYSSTGCPDSFGVVEHPSESACRSMDPVWCSTSSIDLKNMEVEKVNAEKVDGMDVEKDDGKSTDDEKSTDEEKSNDVDSLPLRLLHYL